MQFFRPILSNAGLTEQQWRVLRTLHEEKNLDAATLAQRTQLLAPSLTRMLRFLENANLIERHPAPEDMRRQVIRLSAKGRKTVISISPQIEAVYQQFEETIGPKLLLSLYKDVDDMVERVQRLTNT